MSLGQNARLRQLLALVESGELARARQGAATLPEWAARVGMTEGQLRGVIRRARSMGHTVPGWHETADDRFDASEFDGEEPTKPNVVIEDLDAPGLHLPMTPDLPPVDPIPAGHRIRGLSTLVGPDGDIKGQWIKTAANGNEVDPIAVLRAAFDVMPKADPVAAPEYADDDLLCVYPLGDPHIGMLAWERDAGENFDLSTVERNLFAAVDRLVTLAPPAALAMIATVGDTFHSDGLNNTTTKGTRVDVDGRTPKMIATGVRVFRRMIDRALERHRRVVVKIVPGNHDALLALVLQLALAQFYEDDERVTVDTSPEMFQWLRFGANLIGITHGDKAKAADLLGVMATDRAKDWSDTRHRRFYCGHIHHEVVKELPGLTVEYLRTLASSDAWHRGQGYRSGRDMKLDVFHREHGLINRHIVGIEQIRGGA